jgi:hypothetical protein
MNVPVSEVKRSGWMLYDENMKKQAQLSSILVHNRTHFDFQ